MSTNLVDIFYDFILEKLFLQSIDNQFFIKIKSNFNLAHKFPNSF